ncbi:unnamed protein product, partial [Ectocarpus fasciculatus]
YGKAAVVHEAVDLLLRWGADETSIDDDGTSQLGSCPAELWGRRVEQDIYSAAEAAPVHELLVDAEKDRIWRRRGWLVLCRCFPEKVHMRADGGGANARMGRRVRVRGIAAAAGDLRHGRIGRGSNGVVATVVGLEESVFRHMVKFL